VFWRLENPELQRVFQQGIKQGASYLLAGEPWIGKSTLILQLIHHLLLHQNISIWYVSWEETFTQISERNQRLYNQPPSFDIFETTSCEDIVATIEAWSFHCMIIDSIQTISSTRSDSAPWSASQVRVCCDLLWQAARKQGVTLIYIWHITKAWEIAWPKYLEHIVDVVCYLEWDRWGQYRFLRSKKNRFWTTDETWIFTMTAQWLEAVSDMRQQVLTSTVAQPWSVLSIWVDNGRPVLIAIEVLTNKAIGKYPQRTTLWVETNRLNLLLAVLEKYCWVKLARNDVYINIPWEIKFRDSGIDLWVAAALVSEKLDKKIDHSTVFIGEISLSGKVLPASYQQKRKAEAQWFTCIDHTVCDHIRKLPQVL
jgi:DNA repair protein RadA/Sms